VHSTPASRESREIGVVVDASKAFEGVNGGLVCTGVFLDARARSAAAGCRRAMGRVKESRHAGGYVFERRRRVWRAR